MSKGVTTKKTEVKNQPLEGKGYIMDELEQGVEIEIDVKDFGYYLIKYKDGLAYVKVDDVKEL